MAIQHIRGTFGAYHLSMAARRAAKAAGLATAGYFEPIAWGGIIVYSPRGTKSVRLQREIIELYEEVPNDNLEREYPPCRIVTN